VIIATAAPVKMGLDFIAMLSFSGKIIKFIVKNEKTG
jgi:hypothetical protein